jgi:hypothetical protein
MGSHRGTAWLPAEIVDHVVVPDLEVRERCFFTQWVAHVTMQEVVRTTAVLEEVEGAKNRLVADPGVREQAGDGPKCVSVGLQSSAHTLEGSVAEEGHKYGVHRNAVYDCSHGALAGE